MARPVKNKTPKDTGFFYKSYLSEFYLALFYTFKILCQLNHLFLRI